MMAGTTSRRFFLTLFFLAAIVSSVPAVALAKIHGAEDRKGFTQHDYCKASLDFNRRTIVDAYDKVGHRDDRWNQQAKAFLDAAAVYIAYHGKAALYQDQVPVSPEDLIKLGQTAIDAGCDDPIVLYCQIVGLIDANQTDSVAELIKQALAGMTTSSYAPAWKFALAARTMQYGKSKDTIVGRKLFEESSLDMILTKNIEKPLDRRIINDLISPEFDQQKTVERTQRYQARIRAAKDPVDPWLAAIVAGKHNIAMAWDRRGGGVASTVTKEGAKGFEEYLAEARQQLEAAIALEPDYPEAATSMISIAMAGGTPHTTARQWFDQAVEAQFDYGWAYDRYIYSIRPRWGGSLDEMYAFGIECFESDRFDTVVPIRLLEIIPLICSEQRNYQIWGTPKVVADVQKIYQKVNANWSKKQAAWVTSYHAAQAWRLKKVDEARKALDDAGADFDPLLFARFNLPPYRAPSQIYAQTGPFAKEFAEADKSIEKLSPLEAIKLYDALIKKLPADDKALQYAKSCRYELETVQRFMAGETVEIKPDPEMIGFSPILGRWKVDPKDGSVIGRADDWGDAILALNCGLGPRYEIDLTVEHKSVGSGDQSVFGPVAAFFSPYDLCGVLLSSDAPWMAVSRGIHDWIGYNYRDANPKNQVIVQVFDNRMYVVCNGRPTMNVPLEPGPGKGIQVGMMMSLAPPGTIARYSNMRIRKLSQPPPPVEDPVKEMR